MQRILDKYTLKSANLELKDLDENSRKVAVYLSAFDVMDSDFDIIKKGAFKKSIMERGPQSTSNRKIAFLRYHNWEMPIGKWLELNEDDKGLFAVGQLSNSTNGNDALIDYKEGIIKEHSIGFKYIKDKLKFIEDESMDSKGYYEVNEVALFEGSAVTFGANEFTNVVEVAKSEGKENIAQRIHNEMNMIMKSIANGKGTDDRLFNLEMRMKFLSSQLVDLASIDPFDKQSIKGQSSNEEEVKESFNWASVGEYFSKAETFNDYPQSAVNNAKKGIRLNEETGNKCATAVGKQRARDIAAKRGLSEDVVKRVYSYLSRAREYYNANDEKACGTISYLLWGGDSMLKWSENKIQQIENQNS